MYPRAPTKCQSGDSQSIHVRYRPVMRLSRRLAAAAVLAALPVLAACAKGPIGNTNNHTSVGPPLPQVHPIPVTPFYPPAPTVSAPNPSSSSATDTAPPSPGVSTTAG